MHLASAFLWRLRREGLRYLLSALVPFVLVLALTCVLPSVAGDDLNGAARSAEFAAGLGARHSTVAIGVLLVLGPALTALFSCIGVTRVLQGLVGAEVSRGGFEELLATPYTPGRIAAGLLGCTLLVATGLWAAMSLLAAAALAVLDAVTGSGVDPNGSYLALALLLPLLSAWASGGLALLVSLIFPRLTQLGGGVNLAGGSLGNGVAVLPGLGALLALVLGADTFGPARLLLVAGGTVAVVALASIGGVALGFRPETVLDT